MSSDPKKENVRRGRSALPEESPLAVRSGTAGSLDAPFLVLVLTLVAFGLIMLYSASYAVAYYRFGDSTHFIMKQLIFGVMGVVVMFVVSFIDYHIYRHFVWLLYLVSIVLLVVVLFMAPLNNAHRWINIANLITFQPSEIAKFSIILCFSHLATVNQNKMRTFRYGVMPFVLLLIPVIILMLLEPHTSGTVLILVIAGSLMFIAGTNLAWFGAAFLAIVTASLVAIIAFPNLVPYFTDRISSWQNLNSTDGYQTYQGLLAIGSGGLTGLGLGNSRQKHLYVPEPQNDFIFSILCEELGFIGAMLVVGLFVFLLVRGLIIALRARDKFGSMLAAGIVVQVSIQAILNIMVVTNTIPNTGISLPFFSYGGTSLLMLLAEMGVVLSVSRQANMEKS